MRSRLILLVVVGAASALAVVAAVGAGLPHPRSGSDGSTVAASAARLPGVAVDEQESTVQRFLGHEADAQPTPQPTPEQPFAPFVPQRDSGGSGWSGSATSPALPTVPDAIPSAPPVPTPPAPTPTPEPSPSTPSPEPTTPSTPTPTPSPSPTGESGFQAPGSADQEATSDGSAPDDIHTPE